MLSLFMFENHHLKRYSGWFLFEHKTLYMYNDKTMLLHHLKMVSRY